MLRFNIDFEYNNPKKWVKSGNGYFVGSVFVNNNLLSENEIEKKLKDLRSIEEAIKFTKSLNGSFAMVINFDDSVFLSTDRERTIPIFYELKNDGNVYVYNHISLDMIKSRGINEPALNELNYCLFVSGYQTIACGINSVMAGETVMISNGKVDRKYYFKFDFVKREYLDKQELFSFIDEKFVEVTKRLISFLNGRCAVIPLSGGHDSRLVVYYLKKLGYDNIKTYTYGPKGNAESITSEKVAKYFEIEWNFIEYEPKKLQKFFKDNFKEFVDFQSNGVSSPCIQDWYAVEYLNKHNVFPENAVFIPGHSFDAISGSFILPKYVQNKIITKEQLINDLLWKHYSEGVRELPPVIRNYFINKIDRELLENEVEILSSDRAFNLYQNYNLRERQAKYICAQPKLYEYYGYDWYLPLWDIELVNFWETIDIKYKYNRQLFFEFTKYKYDELMVIAPINKEKRKDIKRIKINSISRVIRKIGQIIFYVDYHYCLAYFTRTDIFSIYLKKRVLNIGFFVNQKIIEIIRRIQND